MTLITVWSLKGGSGCSVVSALIALDRQSREPVLLVDRGDDLAAVLGIGSGSVPSVAELLRLGVALDAETVSELAAEVVPGVRLLPSGNLGSRVDEAVEALRDLPGCVVVDAGCALGSDGHEAGLVAAASHVSLLVTRQCYLSLRRCRDLPSSPTGVVVVAEPGRALSLDDVATAVGRPVVASLAFDPAIARAVDAGLLARRLPRGWLRSVAEVQS